jgi:hypothetical protein
MLGAVSAFPARAHDGLARGLHRAKVTQTEREEENDEDERSNPTHSGAPTSLLLIHDTIVAVK